MKNIEDNKIIYDKDGNKVGEISVTDAVEDLIYDAQCNRADLDIE